MGTGYRAQEIAINRYGRRVAKLVPHAEESGVEAAIAAVRRLRERARLNAGKGISPEEIRAWIDEGRP